jgi:hypothetical protein
MMPNDFSTPEGWRLDGSTLVGPEEDLSVAFVEMESGDDAQKTALTAWESVDPAFDSKVLRDVAMAPQGAWDAMHQIVYEVPARESRIELAVVRRLGSRAFVNIVRGSTAAISRRGAQLNEAILSWKPAGYKEENLKDAASSPWTDEIAGQLRKFMLHGMNVLQIPGVSIAVVREGKVVFAEGFGVRSVDDPAPVTPRSRFMIGSSTKPLTTPVMAKLIDQGKLSWSTPVVGLLNDFSLADPEITQRLQLRHTASASTGMPRQDVEFLFRYSGVTAEDRMAQMKAMRPTTGFGETFQYSNLLVAAGRVRRSPRVCSDGTARRRVPASAYGAGFPPAANVRQFLQAGGCTPRGGGAPARHGLRRANQRHRSKPGSLLQRGPSRSGLVDGLGYGQVRVARTGQRSFARRRAIHLGGDPAGAAQ